MSLPPDPAQAGQPEPAAAPLQPPAPQVDAATTQVSDPASDQPTAVIPPAAADDQPTAVYPPAAPSAYDQPTAAYPPAAEPAAPAYAPYAAPAPSAAVAGNRPKGLAITALILAVLGFVLVGVGFLPLLWVSLVLVLVGGLLLLVALLLAIVALASKKQGGKGLGIAALVVSVLGGFAWIGALVVSLAFIGLAQAGVSAEDILEGSSQGVTTEDDDDTATAAPDDSTAEEAAGAYDEAAYLAAVRPEITDIMLEAVPGMTEADVAAAFSDDTLLQMGAPFAELDEATAAATRDLFIQSMVSSTGETLTEEHAARMFDVLLTAAQQHLVE